MTLSRRSMFKGLATAGAALAATPAGGGAREPKQPPADAVGLLYDSTLCIGCEACMVACREANGLEPEATNGLHDDPADLSCRTKNVIRLYQAEDGREAFVKAQCMHCVDPACASVCMMGALQKREHGVVTWDADRCVGCRYCQVACPFNVPKFEWDAAAPKIVKCELCAHRLEEGEEPACSEVCPRQAVIFGRRADLLGEARRRIEAEPERYASRIYGETDGGGTQVLYLTPAGIAPEALGLPALGERSVPSLPETVQHAIYRGFAAPVALYGVLGAVVWRNRRLQRDAQEEVEP